MINLSEPQTVLTWVQVFKRSRERDPGYSMVKEIGKTNPVWMATVTKKAFAAYLQGKEAKGLVKDCTTSEAVAALVELHR